MQGLGIGEVKIARARFAFHSRHLSDPDIWLLVADFWLSVSAFLLPFSPFIIRFLGTGVRLS
jgi:hypothetical protein